MNRDSIARFPHIATTVGVVLFCAGLVTQIATLRFGIPHPVWEVQLATDAESLGVGLWWIAIATRLVVPRTRRPFFDGDDRTVFITRGLLDVLLDRAATSEPHRESLSLTTTTAGTLDGEHSLDADQPVFTHFVHPSAGRPVRAVFGVDLATSPGRTPGQFISHPRSSLSLTKRDTLREVVFVAVPPWEYDCVAVFDRSGRRMPVEVIDAEPTEPFDDAPPTPQAETRRRATPPSL